MSFVKLDVPIKVQRQLGELEGRWTDDEIEDIVHIADCLVRERCHLSTGATEISLTNGEMYYDLADGIVAITSVEYAEDGSDYDDYLIEATYRDLDDTMILWRDATGTRPTHYVVHGLPGCVGTGGAGNALSQIMIWRPIATTASQSVKVRYLAYTSAPSGLSWNATSAPEWVQYLVHVPLTLALLYANHDVDRAVEFLKEYLNGISQVRARTVTEYGEGS